jgi:hypothetical protein
LSVEQVQRRPGLRLGCADDRAGKEKLFITHFQRQQCSDRQRRITQNILQQTDDLLFTVKDFSARARGVSPSGVAFQPRSSAGSFARTVHYFARVSGDKFWPGGIAYDGDLSVYPADFARPAG